MKTLQTQKAQKTPRGKLGPQTRKARQNWNWLWKDLRDLKVGQSISRPCPKGLTMEKFRTTVLVYARRLEMETVTTRAEMNRLWITREKRRKEPRK